MHVIPYNFNEKSQRNGIFHDDWFQWEFNDCRHISPFYYSRSIQTLTSKYISEVNSPNWNRIENSLLIQYHITMLC